MTEIRLKAVRPKFKMITPIARGCIKALELRRKGFKAQTFFSTRSFEWFRTLMVMNLEVEGYTYRCS